MKSIDTRTSEQVEDAADRLWEQSEQTAYESLSESLQQEAIFTMLRAILLELRSQRESGESRG